MCILKLADLVAIELMPKPIIQAGTIMESLGMGKPIIQARSELPNHIPEGLVPPAKIANSQQELSEALVDFAENRHFYDELGEKGRKWFEEIV